MGILSKPIKTLNDLFVHTLQDVYYAEQKITKALPKMISKVTDQQLQSAFLDPPGGDGASCHPAGRGFPDAR